MTGQKPALSVAEALAHILHNAPESKSETIPLNHCNGRTLQHNIKALLTQPPAPVSAMDGYAVRAEDTQTPHIILNVIGQSPAGKPFKGYVAQGQAVRIFTGGVVPEGADAILIQEDAQIIAPDQIKPTESIKTGLYVRPAGYDFKSGDILLKSGTRLKPHHLALAAAGNHADLIVARKPIVAIIATGDELSLPGEQPQSGGIIASNSFAVSAIIEAAGGAAHDLGIAGDTRISLQEKLAQAQSLKADLIVTLGGASVGDHDLVRDVFVSQGMELDFWKIAMRPGKPLMYGRIGKTVMLGLPGNPVSSIVCAHLFVAPLLAKLCGRDWRPERRMACLASPLKANGPREHYARAKTVGISGDGLPLVEVFADQDSSLLSVMVEANCFAVQKPHETAKENGDRIEIVSLSLQ